MSSAHIIDILEQNNLSFSLTPISVRELLYLKSAPCAIYLLEGQRFKLVKRQHSFINKLTIKEFLEAGHTVLFIPRNEKYHLVEHQQENLRKVTRSLSIGDPIENGKQALNLLTLNLAHLYAYPTNNELLKLQYQSVKNLASFLLGHVDLHEDFFLDVIKQKHYYIYAQPLLSSFLLLGILKFSNHFTPKDIESLFITSYFKDIGMSAIPSEKYQLKNLSTNDRKLFLKHPKISSDLLRGRLPILPHHLNIIENHHAFGLLAEGIRSEVNNHSDHSTAPNDKLIVGIETMLVCTCDIIAAMITERPYREAVGVFEALEKVKELIVQNYPHEFKLLVSYFKNSLFKARKNKIVGQS